MKALGIGNHLAQLDITRPGAIAGKDGNFAQQLTDVLKDVNEAQQQAESKQNALITNQPVDLHDLMIAMERASTAMQLTMQVRNKLLEAYQEITRMQV